MLDRLDLGSHLLEYAFQGLQPTFIAVFENFRILTHNALGILNVAEDSLGLLLIESVLLLEVLLSHAKWDDVAVEFGFGTDADRADEVFGGLAVHG